MLNKFKRITNSKETINSQLTFAYRCINLLNHQQNVIRCSVSALNFYQFSPLVDYGTLLHV